MAAPTFNFNFADTILQQDTFKRAESLASGLTSCPTPFVNQYDYPTTGGYIAGRFCSNVTATLSCCLPCPISQWTYSDALPRNIYIAEWINVPGLVLMVFLLLSFAFLKEEDSRRHFMSVGLVMSIIIIELSFILPLATHPKQCYNEITPNDMHSSLSCGWSGALLQAGGMSGSMWILCRSLLTHLRVCWDIKQPSSFVWVANALSWGVTAVFLAISLPITGVSYRLGPTCTPNAHYGFATWFAWLLAISSGAALIQLTTSAFCLSLYLRNLWSGANTGGSNAPLNANSSESTASPSSMSHDRSGIFHNTVAWKRVRKILMLQWRSIALSIVVIVENVFYCIIFTTTQHSRSKTKESVEIEWGECLILSGGDKDKCLYLAKEMGTVEDHVDGTFFLSATLGFLVFLLMVRRSMFTGWWQLIRNPREYFSQRNAPDETLYVIPPRRKKSAVAALGLGLGGGKRETMSTIEDEKMFGELPKEEAQPHRTLSETGILPEPPADYDDEEGTDRITALPGDYPGMFGSSMPIPEAGDVSSRHSTSALFEYLAADSDAKQPRRRSVEVASKRRNRDLEEGSSEDDDDSI